MSGTATTSSTSQYASLRARFAALEKQVTLGVPGVAQSRGRAIERLLHDLLDLERLDPRTSYRPRGEEIDGSFVLDHRVYLLELKWRKDPTPASDLYAFKGKLDGKLDGTIGVFISVTGYSNDAIDALTQGKTLNLILWNGDDLRAVLDGDITFADAQRAKLRYAHERGRPFFPITRKRVGPTKSKVAAPVTPAVPGSKASGVRNVIVEGAGDRDALQMLLAQLSPARVPLVDVWSAGGALNMVPLAQELHESGHDVDLLMDADVANNSVKWSRVREELQENEIGIYEIRPDFQTAIERHVDVDVDYANAVPETGIYSKRMRRWARHVNADEVFNDDEGLRSWLASLTHRG